MARLDRALALGRDGGDRFVPWVVALQAFFATLALAGFLALDRAVEHWQSGAGAAVTVQLAAGSAPAARAAALHAMRRTPGIARAEAMSSGEAAALLAPWLDDGARADELPLPMLIGVHVAPGASVDWAAAERRLRAVAPGARLDRGGARVGTLLELARAARVGAVAVLAFIAAVTVLVAVLATRAALTAHRGAIELLHWLGARDRAIAAVFRRRAARLGFRGGLFGTATALAVLFLLARSARGFDDPLLLDLAAPSALWAVFAAVPFAVSQAAALAARKTVLRTLARMP